MPDKSFWFFLQLPYNLSLVFLISWFHENYNKSHLPILFSSGALIAALWLEGFPRIFFWLPSGASTIILASLFTLIYLKRYSKNNQTLLKIPDGVSWDRKILKQEFSNVEDSDARQRIYLDLIKKLNNFLDKIDQKMGAKVNRYFLILLATLFLVNFGYWVVHYLINGFEISSFFSKDRIKNLIPDKKLQSDFLKFYDQYGNIFINYSASLTMVLNTISLFLILPIVRWIKSKKDSKSFFWLDLCFFRLPESTILLYIPIICLFTISLFYDIFDGYAYWFNNFVFIFSFVYFLNGFAIARAYAKARFLPFGVFFLIVFFVSWFAPHLFLLIIFSLFMIGLLDFAFDIKKKALHHVSVRIDKQ